MSITVYRRAREATLRHPLKAVLKELSFFAHDDGGSIYPSVSKLARYSGLTDRGVQKCLAELEGLGYISRPAHRIGGNHKQTAHYRINLDMLPPIPTGEQDSPLAERVNAIHPTGERCALTGEHGALTGERGSPNRPDRQDKPERPALNRSNGHGKGLSNFTWDELQMMKADSTRRNEPGRLAEIAAEIERRTFEQRA